MSFLELELGPDHVGYTARIATSVLDIDRTAWDRIWPCPGESYEVYRIQEEAGIAGVTFTYLVLDRGGRTVLIAPLFFSGFDIGLALPDRVRRSLARALSRWPTCLEVNALFCGGPTVEQAVIAMDPDTNPGALVAAFNAALAAEARRVRARMIIVKDLTTSTATQLGQLLNHGFVKTEALPMPVLDLPYESVDDYLAGRSAGLRKDLRRKAKRSNQRGGLDIEITSHIDGREEAIAELYRRTAARSELNFGGTLTAAYFRGYGKHLPKQALYILYHANAPDGRRLIGFNLCLHRGNALVDKYIGLDYELSLEHSLYFTSFLYNVGWCIDHQVTSYVLNFGAEELKVRLGARMEQRWHFSRIVNPALNRIGRWFTPASAKTP